MNTCECGQPATEVCYRRGSSDEIWFCGARKHRADVRELAAQGWHSQSATVASSPAGTAIRRHLQATERTDAEREASRHAVTRIMRGA